MNKENIETLNEDLNAENRVCAANLLLEEIKTKNPNLKNSADFY